VRRRPNDGLRRRPAGVVDAGYLKRAIRRGPAPTSRPSPYSMYHREYPISPWQAAINGALCIYVEGGKKENARQMLFGLSVLRQATEEQIQAAIPHVQTSQRMSRGDIQDMLAK
jgi:hypothetical protein